MKAKPQPRPDVRELLALNLKRERAMRGWSQDTLALEAGLDRTFVAHVERMKRNISLDNIEKLAAALDVPLYRLLAVEARANAPVVRRGEALTPPRTAPRTSRRRAIRNA